MVFWLLCVFHSHLFADSHPPPIQAITTPAMAVSHIMLEAYKKYILVSLILHGKVQQLPKYTSQIVGRFIKVCTTGQTHNLDLFVFFQFLRDFYVY